MDQLVALLEIMCFTRKGNVQMKRKRVFCCVMALVMLAVLPACGGENDAADTGLLIPEQTEGVTNGLVEDPNTPSDPTGSEDAPVTVDPNEMTADQRQELLMSNEENLPYYMRSGMSEEQMEYRFNIYRYGLNFVNEHAVSSDGELYDDLCRNIFSYADSAREICVTGTVEWCSRDGSFTEFW